MLRNPHVGATEAALELAYSIDQSADVTPTLLGWTDECVSAYFELAPEALLKFAAFARDNADGLALIARKHRVKYFQINATELKGGRAAPSKRIDFTVKVQS